MKNKFKLIGIAVVVAVIGLSMVACGDDLSGGLPDIAIGGQNVTFFGPTLTIRGHAETPNPPRDEWFHGEFVWDHFYIDRGNEDSSFPYDPGTGIITQGQLLFTAGAPGEIEDRRFQLARYMFPERLGDVEEEYWDEVWPDHDVAIFWGLELEAAPGMWIPDPEYDAEDQENAPLVWAWGHPDEEGNMVEPEPVLLTKVVAEWSLDNSGILDEFRNPTAIVQYVWVSRDFPYDVNDGRRFVHSYDGILFDIAFRAGWNAVTWNMDGDRVVSSNPARAIWLFGFDYRPDWPRQ